jgi:ribosome-associated heat shock protein Hsp15
MGTEQGLAGDAVTRAPRIGRGPSRRAFAAPGAESVVVDARSHEDSSATTGAGFASRFVVLASAQMRLDQWLWAVRVFKSRTLAADAIKAGHARVNGETAKPSHEVKPGEIVTARVGVMTRTMRVNAAPMSRVGAKLVAQFAEDLTPPEEWEKRNEPMLLPPGFRPRGAGRPTKRDRREIDELGAS